MRLFLDVPYAQKEEAKALGARWNPKVRKWYIDSNPAQYIKFEQWIHGAIVMDNIYILEAQQNCFHCKKPTTVIGFGVENHFEIEDGEAYYGPPGIHLCWSPDTDKIPPALLNYIQKNYSVSVRYSRTTRSSSFSNFCQNCNMLQGNYYLFNEPGSPLRPDNIKNIKIFKFRIRDALILDWDISYSFEDDMYYKCEEIKKVFLTADSSPAKYEDLY